MPFNGSGTYELPAPEYPAVPNTPILASDFNTIMSDIATALSLCLTRDGQSVPVGDITLGGMKITNLAAPLAANDAANKGYVDGIATNIYAYIDTPTGNRNMNGFRITNMGDPVDDQDAVTLLYMNNLIPNFESEQFQASTAFSILCWLLQGQ